MNYIQISLKFIMESTNNYLIQPINDNLVQPIFNTSEKYIRFDDIIGAQSVNHIDHINHIDANDVNVDDKLEWITFYHLKKNNQTYFQHLSESLGHSSIAFKASFYFFVHAFIPSLFEYNGSTSIYSLTDTIKSKYGSDLQDEF